MQPLAILLETQNIIAVSTICILTLLIISFKFQIKRYLLYSLIIISIIFLTNYFLFNVKEITLVIFIEFLAKSFSLMVIGSYPINTKYLVRYFYIFSLVNFISLSLILFFGLIDSISYMRFGYAMLPTVLFSCYAFSKSEKYRKAIWLIVCVSSFLMTLVYGSRGPMLGLLIFVLIILFFDPKIHFIKKAVYAITLTLGVSYLLVFNGLIRFLDYIYYDLNISTYSIIKLKIMLEEGLLESSSGRDNLYENFFEQIIVSPIFGNGIGITQKLWGVTPHNMFLQIMIEFGIIGLAVCTFLAGFLVYALFKIRKVDNVLFFLLSIIFAVSFGRLLVSSDLWLRPELWLFISLSINNFKTITIKRHKKNRVENKLNTIRVKET
ncbi:O-antigen polymerase [Bacillus infantis]|uniref:O-antigen ligase family protein n=1 Tax=Bacillus infantis TaxID=324767 RepID=UPI0030B8C794